VKDFISAQLPFALTLVVYELLGQTVVMYYVLMTTLFIVCFHNYVKSTLVASLGKYHKDMMLTSGCSEHFKCPHIVAAALLSRGWLYKDGVGWSNGTGDPANWRAAMYVEGLGQKWK